MSKHKFENGDRVVIISECNSKGKHGTVVGYTRDFWTQHEHVSVKLDSGIQLSYNEKSLKKNRNIPK